MQAARLLSLNLPYCQEAIRAISPFLPFVIGAVIWTLVLKGFALWYAGNAKQKGWFIALLVINTLGVLEIIYLIWFRRESPYVGPAPVIQSSVRQ